MNKEELINWFNNIFNNCYYVTHDDYPEYIFMYYDLRYIRKLKLSNIEKKECFPPKIISGECLFHQNWENKTIWCKYSVIWKYLEDNYSSNYSDIQSFIKDRLEEQDKMKVLTPFWTLGFSKTKLEEQDKMKVLTPFVYYSNNSIVLEEQDKMKVLTPRKLPYQWDSVVGGTLEDKMKVLIPEAIEINIQ
jgi:hypothetical protein